MIHLNAARNALAEAQALAPEGTAARVLEPSPPAVDDGDFYADDPASLGEADASFTARPMTEGSAPVTWEQLAGADDAIASFARPRWLGPWPRLGAVPDGYVASREDFHRLAYGVVGPARYQTNGKFGLRYTAGGFGTPFFGDDRQVRVVGNLLVDQQGDHARQHEPTSLNDAAAFLGTEVSDVAGEGDSPPLGDYDRPLRLDAATGAFLGDWYGFVVSVLEQLRAEATPDQDASRVQLWPGHFDPAFELGAQEHGHRATMGGSPGDDGSEHPYLYIGPWAGTTEEPFWNATSFPGAVLPYADIVAAEDQRAMALDFYRKGADLLAD